LFDARARENTKDESGIAEKTTQKRNKMAAGMEEKHAEVASLAS